jgi:hypothetical protein
MEIWETTTEEELKQLFSAINKYYVTKGAAMDDQKTAFDAGTAVELMRNEMKADFQAAIQKFDVPDGNAHHVRQIKLKYITIGLGDVRNCFSELSNQIKPTTT